MAEHKSGDEIERAFQVRQVPKISPYDLVAFVNDSSLANTLARFFDIRPGEGRRVTLMVSLLFLLLAANNVIKVERDSLFLSRFSLGDFSYVSLLVPLLAGLIIDVYTRYTIGLPFYQLILGTYALIISNVCVFWYLIVSLIFVKRTS